MSRGVEGAIPVWQRRDNNHLLPLAITSLSRHYPSTPLQPKPPRMWFQNDPEVQDVEDLHAADSVLAGAPFGKVNTLLTQDNISATWRLQ